MLIKYSNSDNVTLLIYESFFLQDNVKVLYFKYGTTFNSGADTFFLMKNALHHLVYFCLTHSSLSVLK
jgi:hypothetical protein